MRNRTLLTSAVAAVALLSTPTAARTPANWARAWTASPFAAPRDKVVTIADATLRTSLRVNAGGSALRLRLSNEFGDKPVRIAGATIRRADGTTMPVRFGGSEAIEIPAGAPLVSDPVPLPAKAFELLGVTLYLREATALATVHAARGSPTEVSPSGGTATRSLDLRPLIAGIDVQTPKPRPVVVAFGDSITDASGCPYESPEPCRWGDVLGRRLAARGAKHIVVTQAIGGNRLLSEQTGQSALARFDRDVLSIPGVTHVVILEGINDIGAAGDAGAPPLDAARLIAGYRQLIARAHEHGIRVIGLTILPFGGARRFTPAREAIRVAVNDWIRTGGAFDATFDMDRVVADPADPTRLAAALQQGDNLHPNALGERRMGDALPLGLFR